MLFGPKFASLVFSDTFIKVASAKPTAKGLKIFYLNKKTLPVGAVTNGRIADINLFKEALKTFFLENYEQLKTRSLALGLNEQEVFLSAIRFEEKPKNLIEEIRGKIADKLPFDPAAAAIFYQEASHRVYQVVAIQAEILQTTASVFQEVGFSLKALIPIPLIFPRLVGQREAPYLFISSEGEDLIYALVIKNTVAFSSTVKLKKPIVESEKEIIRLAKEIIEEEYPEKGNEPLKNIHLLGKNVESLNMFFRTQNFNTEVISLSSLPLKQSGYNLADFSRVLSLSFYDDSVLAIRNFSISKISRAKSTQSKKGRSPLKYFIFVLLILFLAAGLFLFWPNLKEMFLNITQGQKVAAPPKVATAASIPKSKEATPAAEKKAATASPQLQEEIKKSDFKIQVLNGTGKAGAASGARDFLVAKGYNVVNVGNASNFNYQTSFVQVKQSKQQITDLLTNDLKERYTVTVGLPLAEGTPFDIIIIIGGK